MNSAQHNMLKTQWCTMSGLQGHIRPTTSHRVERDVQQKSVYFRYGTDTKSAVVHISNLFHNIWMILAWKCKAKTNLVIILPIMSQHSRINRCFLNIVLAH